MNPAPPVTSAFTSPRRGAPPARSASCEGETGAEPGECPPQPFVDVDPWLPAEQRPRPRDVGLPDLGVVFGKRLEHDLARRAAEPKIFFASSRSVISCGLPMFTGSVTRDCMSRQIPSTRSEMY